jgi:hypothetical protein
VIATGYDPEGMLDLFGTCGHLDAKYFIKRHSDAPADSAVTQGAVFEAARHEGLSGVPISGPDDIRSSDRCIANLNPIAKASR